MKRKHFFLFLLLFVLSFSIFAENVRLLSFNIQGTKSKRNDEKWIEQISSVIKDSKADIVLLQEFPIKDRNRTIIDSFLDKLGNKNWEFFCTDKYIKTGNGYPFTQNNIIFFNQNSVLAPRGDNFPVNFEDSKCPYSFEKNNYQVVYFCLSSEQTKDFLVVNIHLPFDKDSNPKWKKYYSDLEELSKLYSTLSSDYNIVIGGDFNTSRDGLLNNQTFKDAIIDGQFGKFTQYQGLLTTISNGNDENRYHGIKLSNDYDHFIVKGPKIAKEMKHSFYWGSDSGNNSYSKIKIGSKTYQTGKSFKSGLSDHLPVLIELSF